jgi:hypothetical protein
MDAKRFDAITRAWVSLPRRRLLGWLAAGTLGPLLGLGGREASAITCQDKDDCPDGQVCKNKTCVARCGTPGTCESGFTFGCQGDGSCLCAKKPGGGGLCVETVGLNCTNLQGCRRQSDCPQGTLCSASCCETKFVCRPPCGESLPTTTGAAAGVEGGAEGGQLKR